MNEERALKKKWLKRYRFFMDLGKKEIDDVEELKSRLYGLSASRYEMRYTQGYSSNYTKENLIDMIDQKIDSMVNHISKALDAREEIENAINQIDDYILQEVLFERYILGFDFRKIAKEMEYSEKYIADLHGNAVDKIQIESASGCLTA